jgi:hypothetical protein
MRLARDNFQPVSASLNIIQALKTAMAARKRRFSKNSKPKIKSREEFQNP